jgi:hypothetical protein
MLLLLRLRFMSLRGLRHRERTKAAHNHHTGDGGGQQAATKALKNLIRLLVHFLLHARSKADTGQPAHPNVRDQPYALHITCFCHKY